MKRFRFAMLGTLGLWGALRVEAADAPPAPPVVRRGGPTPSSPLVSDDRHVTFRMRAPDAKQILVSGQWGKDKTALTKDADGLWSATVGPVEPGVYEYSLSIDGRALPDPGNPVVKPQRLQPPPSLLEVRGTPARLTEFQDVPHGAVRIHHYRSKAVGQVRRLHVYTPPGYDKKGAGAYPTLYLFHGSGDNDATWTVDGRAPFILDNLIAQGKARPMVVVMPDGHPVAPDAAPAPDAAGSNTDVFARDVLSDVMPFIEANYRVKKTADTRAVIGLSMGGQQSLTIGLTHPELFAWVGGFSSAPPTDATLGAALADPKAVAKKLRWLWLGCGKDDFLLKRNEALVATLKEKGVPLIWHLTEGVHSWLVWRDYLAEVAPQLFAGK